MVLKGEIAGYSRVSYDKQEVEKYGKYFDIYQDRTGERVELRVFEKISATKTSIQQRDIWKLVNNKEITKIIVPSTSRIGRSVPDGVDLIRQISVIRNDLEIYIMDKNLTVKKNMSPGDTYHFYDLMNRAAIEVAERIPFIKLGMEDAKKRGVRLGRPPVSSLESKRKEVYRYLDQGRSKAFIARTLNVSIATVFRFLNKEEKEILNEMELNPGIYKYNFKDGTTSLKKKKSELSKEIKETRNLYCSTNNVKFSNAEIVSQIRNCSLKDAKKICVKEDIVPSNYTV